MARPGEKQLFDESMVDTVLAEDINFKGTMKFSKSLMIKGRFEGEIDATGHLIIGENAVIQATIKAGDITNFGEIIGNVEAIEKLEMFNSAKLTGDIVSPELFIESGCLFNGNCKMVNKKGGNTHHNNEQNASQNQQQPKKH